MGRFDSIEFQDIPDKVICAKIFNALVEVVQPLLTDEASESLDRCILTYCKYADHLHETDGRVFAHTFHKPWVICVSRSINSLEPEQILGILAHEIGHFLGGRSEHEADRFIRDLGLVVVYRGKNSIQHMDRNQLWNKTEWNKIIGGK